MKQFEHVILKVESCSLDAILQIFKRSICLGTPFFESLAKKLSAMMDNLFKWANKNSMLKDNVHVTRQHVLVTSRPTKNDHVRSTKPTNQLSQANKGQDSQQRPTQTGLNPINISYNKLFPMKRDLSDFRWLEPIKTDPAKRDRSRKCVYHKEHGHTTKQCRSLHYLVERLIRVMHLKQYIRSNERRRGTTQDPAIQVPSTTSTLRAIINYIHGGLIGKKYNSKQKKK